MLRIAICQKEPTAPYKDFVARYVSEKGMDCTVASFETGATFLRKYKDFDAVFMDVELDDNGVQVAETLREKSDMPIVFIVGEEQFSIKGNKADAMDFLTRPVSYYAFSTMLDRLQTRMIRTDAPAVAVMTKNGARKMSVDEISYIESKGLNSIYHLTDGSVLKTYGTLNDAAKKLTEERFFRLGGYLINLGCVNKVSGADVYVETACLPLPYNKKAAFLSSLLAFADRG